MPNIFKPEITSPLNGSLVDPKFSWLWDEGFRILSPLDKRQARNISPNGFADPVETSTGIVTIDTEFGRALDFPNATINPPDDIYHYSGLPTTSADVVPHTACVVWRGNTSRVHNHFGQGSAGTGWFLQGGASSFVAVHGGIIAFAGIGTFVVGDWFFQCYSYDLVTMRHLVKNLTTGVTVFQEVAETRTLANGSQPTLGAKGNFTVSRASISYAAWKPGALTIPQMQLWADDPFAFITLAEEDFGFVAGAPPGGLSIPVAMYNYRRRRVA